MPECPAFVEVEPDSWEPIELCSRDDIAHAADRLMVSAVMLAREALEDAERFGSAPINRELMEKSERDRADAEALFAYLGP